MLDATSFVPSWASGLEGPRRGPFPMLAYGTGRTGKSAKGGNSAMTPGYVSDSEVYGYDMAYDPPDKDNRLIPIPNAGPQTGTWTDGIALLGTYRAHDFAPAQRFFHQAASTQNWQQMNFVEYRDLLQYQNVQKYRPLNPVVPSKPVYQNEYFLGYQQDTSVAAQIGGINTLGYM